VQEQVITPLRARESSRGKMSRAAVPPQKRRVRIIDAALRTDEKGQQFVAFAVDAQHGFGAAADDNWSHDEATGCVYTSGAVYLRGAASYQATTARLSKKKSKSTDEVPAHICHDRPAQVAALR